ncbi:MAG: sorbosone dehydrogenase [Planctomycetia bacterium]|nr:sorbosone dehydrogenase [Planctomycetia bacterium]
MDHDGRADKSTVFADGLLVPHSVIPGDGGAYVTQSTQLLFLKDTNGDGRADARRVLLTGFGNADVHHMIHTLRWGPDGNLYFNQSIYINSTIETPWGIRQLNAAGTWRFRPTSMRLEVFSRGLVNPWGHTFDAWGQSFGTDGAAGGGISYMFPGSAFMSAADVHRIMAPLNPGHTKACGVEVLSGRHLSEEWRDTLMTTNFLANRVVRYRLSDRGSSYASQPLADLMKSSDRSFRPVDVKMGPDGAIYIVDWYSPVIDHGEVDFHHPLRNHEHGRIWRVTQKGRSLVTPPKLTGASTEELLDALKLPEGWSRDQARRLLKERGAEEVMPALRKWLAGLSPSDPNVEHQRLEALWVCQSMGIVSPRELRSVLKSPDGRARAAAVRVLADWQTHIPDAAKLLAAAVADEYPRVRLEAVTASRQAQTLEAANLAMRVLDQPIDDTLDYAAWLAARELKDFWLAELHAGRPVFGGNSQHLAFALNAVGGRDTLAPLVELARGGKLAGAAKISTLETIAKLGGPDDLAVVVDEVVRSADQDTAEADRLLTALERAAGAKKQAPKNGALIVEVLTNGKTKTSTREISARLCGAWKLVAAREALAKMAGDSSRGTPLATAAALGLASLGDAESLGRLAELAGGNGPTPLRMAAVAAWAGTNPQMAASRAVQLLEKLSAEDDPEPVITAFLSRRDGPQALAAALAGKRLPPAVSDAGVRLVNSSGRDLTALREALLAARAEKLVGTQFSPADQKQLLADVATRGDAARGEMIFRRADTSCMKCHAIGGYGGYVGPDLASLGGGAELPHLLQSILEPSAKIKEGFQTVNVSLTDGWIITGVVKQKTNSTVIVRDALDQLHFIPSGDIDELTQSNISLMPTGLANSLSKDELLHLVRFLSVLGREPRYTVSTRPLVRYWQWLEPSPAAELFARSIASGGEQGAGGKSLKWTTRLSTVAGSLPLSELPKLGGDFQGVSIVRFFVELKEAGSVPFRAVGGEGIRLAAPDGLKPLSADYAVSLPAGRQAITLLIDRQQAGNMLEIELTEAKESGPQAVLVQP